MQPFIPFLRNNVNINSDMFYIFIETEVNQTSNVMMIRTHYDQFVQQYLSMLSTISIYRQLSDWEIEE